jgi:hypothetical protein
MNGDIMLLVITLTVPDLILPVHLIGSAIPTIIKLIYLTMVVGVLLAIVKAVIIAFQTLVLQMPEPDLLRPHIIMALQL